MGAKIPNKADRRVQRTRRILRDALIALTGERSWDEIKVKDVCARANVGRSTFYTHFADKEDVLVSGFDDFRDSLTTVGADGERVRVLGFTLGMLEHAHSHQRLLRAMLGKRAGVFMQRQLRRLLVELIQAELARLPIDASSRELAVRYLAGAFVELITWWLESRSELSPAQVDEAFRRMSARVVHAACGS